MGNNNFTETFQDGLPLTQAMLETAYKSLTLDISNTTQMVAGSTAGTFLQSNGDSVAASFESIPDPLGLFAIRNYGLSAVASSSNLVVSLKDANGADPSTGSYVDVTFSSNGSSSATYTPLTVTNSLSITVPASATLGVTGTSTARVFVYAINNVGAVNLAVSSRSDLDCGEPITTTVINTSADSLSALYSTASLSVCPRLLGWVDTSLDASLNWQTPTKTNITNNADLTNANTANRVVYQNTSRQVAGTVAAGGVAISLSSGAFSTNNTTFTDVTNMTVIITTSGKPVRIGLINDGTASNPGAVAATKSTATSYNIAAMQLQFLRGASAIATYPVSLNVGANTTSVFTTEVPASSFEFLDLPAAGTYTYSVQIKAATADISAITNYIKLFAYEL